MGSNDEQVLALTGRLTQPPPPLPSALVCRLAQEKRMGVTMLSWGLKSIMKIVPEDISFFFLSEIFVWFLVVILVIIQP